VLGFLGLCVLGKSAVNQYSLEQIIAPTENSWTTVLLLQRPDDRNAHSFCLSAISGQQDSNRNYSNTQT